MDSASSCPFAVNRYSTRGGISLYACLLKTPFLSRAFSRIARVLLLKPFIVFLNFRYLTESVVQHKGNSISRVPLFVISFLSEAVSSIRVSMSYPLKLQETPSLIIGNLEGVYFVGFAFLADSFFFCFPKFTYFTKFLLPL